MKRLFRDRLADADSMLAAGGSYRWDNTSIEGNLSMMILYDFGGFRPFWRAQVWAVEHLISVHCASGDFRWAIAALALRSFAALEAFAQKQLVSLARTVMGRAWQGARFAASLTDADTMVAAGGR
jgi:hypothetical protein